MLQEAPINRDEKLPAGDVIHARLTELSKATEEEFKSVPFESGRMECKPFLDYIAALGQVGLRVDIIGTARRSLEEVDSDTNELHILDTEVAIEKLEANYPLDPVNEKIFSLAVDLILSICADEPEKSVDTTNA